MNDKMDLEEEIRNIMTNCAKEHTNIALMNQKLNGLAESQIKILEKLENLDEKLDRKYAPMLSWVILKWAGAVAGSVLIVALVNLILKDM